MTQRVLMVFTLYIQGDKPALIAEKLGLEAKRVSQLLSIVPRDIRLGNLKLFKNRLSKGWEQWNEYILSPDREKFMRMAKNGLWVDYTPTINVVGNKEYRRLGKTYLSKVEEDIKSKRRKAQLDKASATKFTDDKRATRNAFRKITNKGDYNE